MKRLDAQQVCNLLNGCDEVMLRALMERFNVNYALEPTALHYSCNDDGVKSTSSLGVINGLVSEPICVDFDNSLAVKGTFRLLSDLDIEG